MKKIVIIDDNPLILCSLKKLLNLAGYKVETAENGQVGFSKMIKTHPDLVLIDINMPILDGFSLIEKIKENKNIKHIPIIVLSAFKDSELIMRCDFMGVKNYITKPYDQKGLILRIENVIEASNK